MLKSFCSVLVGLSMLALGPLSVDARGGGGGGGGFGYGGGRGYGGGYGGYGRGFGGGFYGGYGYGLGYGLGGYGYPGYGYDYGYGPSYGAGYGPNYYDYGYATPAPAVYTAPLATVPTIPLAPAALSNNTAEIEVSLPRADAKVSVDGNPMTNGSGTQRAFTSPSLEPGYSYSYRVSASWMDNGKEVRMERTVNIAPGRVSRVDFGGGNGVRTMPTAQD